MRKYLALLTTVFCLLFVFGLNTRAAQVYNDYTYTVNSDGTVKIVGYYGKAKAISVPATIDGKKVTAIASYVFNGKTTLTSVSIPTGIASIGNNAFEAATQLKTVRLPKGLKTIGKNAFKDCSSLASVNIPSGITEIDDYLFYNCLSLSAIKLPSTIKTIGNYAFFGCKGLKSVNIPKNTTAIGQYAFNYCIGLTDITIPSKVQELKEGTFGNCSGLRTITIAKKVNLSGNVFGLEGPHITIYGYSGSPAEDYAKNWNIGFILLDPLPAVGSQYKVDGNRYIITSINTVTYKQPVSRSVSVVHIPSYITIKSRVYSVTAIYQRAFYGCKALRAAVVPSTARQIGPQAFAGCKKLKRIYIVSRLLRKHTIGLKAFKNIHKKAKFYVPRDLRKAYKRVLRKRGAGKKIKVKGL